MNKFYTVLITLLFSLPGFSIFSQISQGGLPISFQNDMSLKTEVPVKIMPPVDVKTLLKEDSLNDGNKEIPWRFGLNIYVNYDLSNTGGWDLLPNGDKLWRLGIKCPGAFSINLTFDKYCLPPGARFFEYNNDKTQVIGAFTDFNNRSDSAFATTLIQGEEVILEYYEPKECRFQGKIHLNRVTHGYRDTFRFIKDMGFGDSDTCNNNVHCPKAVEWQNQVRSVCLILSGGSAWCSGALVNNTSQDGTPYILLASHCLSDPSTWVFWFNWESPTCENPPAPPAYNSITGASLVAKSDTSDFCLLKLSSVPPAGYGVYYAGWNRNNVPATSAAMVHHPEGDIKKISYTSLPLIDTIFGYFWEALWDDGITQPGSSGAPLFDQHHLIVGFDHGGLGLCAQSRRWCIFGKFAIAWDYSSHPTSRLKEWLDPIGTGVDTLPGWDPNGVPVPRTPVYEIQILPNPSDGKFMLINATGKSDRLDVRIIDLEGRIIFKQMMTGNKAYDIDLSSAKPSIYLVIINSGNDVVVKKVVISK